MAQIIKHRRGSIDSLKGTTARNGELIVASGSISDLGGPFVFIGSPNSGDEGVAGAFRPVSKIYTGTAAPSLAAATYGSILDGTPFYATSNKSLYVLNNSGAGGNTRIDLTGNIEGNIISGVTIQSLTGSNANITNITGSTISGSNVRVTNDLSVGGMVNVTGDISGSNLNLTGNATIDGNIVLGGNITIGNQTTDLVVFQGEVSSSILPEVNNSFDLGGLNQAWRNLYVSGTANVGTLNAGTISLSGITIFQDLVVSGSSYLGQGGGDNVIVSGSIYNDALTEKRLVVAGADGLLTNYSGLTFDNGNLNLSGSLEVTNIQGTGSLYLQADKTDLRHFEIYNTSATDVHIKSNGGLSFFGDDTNYLKIDDSISAITINSISGLSINTSKTMVTGSIYNDQLTNNRIVVVGADGLLEDDSNFTFDGTTLQVGAGWFGVDTDGDIRTSGSLLVTGGSEFKSGVGINSTLDVTGSAQFKSTINVDNEATLASAIVEDLTQDRIVIVGAGGALIDSSGFTYNGTVFKIGNGQFEVDTNDGDIRTSGSLTVEGGQTINGDVTVNGVLTVTGNTELQSNLYVSGNLEVLGSSTNVIIQSQTVELDDNIIRLNAYSPFERYAGFEVIDSGSTNMSASLLWDGQNDYWMFMSSSGQSSKLIGTTAGTYGTEVSLTDTYFPIATGPNTIGDSLLRYSGTTLSFNTNKFTIDSGTGDTLVSGNFTLSYSGGTDTNSNTSAIMFRNSNNVVGFVSTTETEDVLDGILGYKNSNGALVFSTVIDGGTYS